MPKCSSKFRPCALSRGAFTEMVPMRRIWFLLRAQNQVRLHYNVPGVQFTFDGKLIGDISEAIAARMFGITLS